MSFLGGGDGSSIKTRTTSSGSRWTEGEISLSELSLGGRFSNVSSTTIQSDKTTDTTMTTYVKGIAGKHLRQTITPGFVKQGQRGTKIPLISNYFHLNKNCPIKLLQYHVEFIPEEDNTLIKKRMVQKHEKSIGPYIFDGHMLYKSELLREECHKIRFRYGPDNSAVTITIKYVGHVHPNDHMYFQFYNIVMRKCLSLLHMEEIGRHFYDRERAKNFPKEKLQLWPGVITAIKQHEGGPLLCIEVTHKVLRTSSVAEMIKSCRRDFRDKDLCERKIKEKIIGTIVMTHYNRKTYRIDDVIFNKTPLDTFTNQKGDHVSFADYYRNQYDIPLTGDELDQPLLFSKAKLENKKKGMKGDVLLIPSLCYPTGLSDDMRADYDLMKTLSSHLHMDPDARKAMMDDFVHRFHTNPEVTAELESWKVELGSECLDVTGRVIDKQTILISNPRSRNSELVEIRPDDKADWTRGLKDGHMIEAKSMNKWIVFVVEEEAVRMRDFISVMKQTGREIGMQIADPLEIIRYNSRTMRDDMIKMSLEKYKTQGIDLVFFVLPNNQLARYSKVKKIITLNFKSPSQAFLLKNLKNERNRRAICTKVMIQVNAKMGGIPWLIKLPPNKKIMILGFDVYHCPERKGESVGALVATCSPNLGTYYSTTSFHKQGTELSINLCTDTSKSLEAYYQRNGDLPDRIILFRDGVGEGQVNFVLDSEVRQVQQAIKGKYIKYDLPVPKFSFVIVTKKINTRAIVQRKMRSGNVAYQNPPSGTVIDDVVTLPERYDFFLVAQSVRQGTVSPTNYNVVFDDSGWSADIMQNLAFKMCHSYYNWSGTVAVPAPCQYAHKLAYLTGVSLNNHAPSCLQDKLWYL